MWIRNLAASVLTGTMLFGNASTVGAEELLSDEDEMLSEESAEEMFFEDTDSEDVESGSDVKRIYELHLEYLAGNWAESRHVNNYNVHLYRKMHEHRALSFFQGLTFTRATGYISPAKYGRRHLDSESFGVGVGGLLRWDSELSGKLHASLDFAGSIMLYPEAHPATGRAYGFLWRLGPRMSWKYSGDDAVSVAYYISHFSNGMHTHNPGYDMRGFSLGIDHKF